MQFSKPIWNIDASTAIIANKSPKINISTNNILQNISTT